MKDTHLLFSDNIVKVNPVPLPPAIDISLKDKSEDNNTIIYGSIKTSSNWISITDTKTDEFNALKQYLNPPSYTATFPITGEQLREIFCVDSKGNSIPLKKCKTPSLERCTEVANLINKYSDEYGLTTAERISHFIGQIGAESSLSSLKEEYCYSKERAKVIFGKVKYCDLFVGYTSNMDECNGKQPATCTPKLTKITSEMVVKDKYACSLKLFDYVYSCRLGNGTPNSGDGGRFRGRAFLHLTGKEKYETLETKWNATFPKNKKDFTCDSDECEATRQLLVTDLDFAMRSSLAFWSSESVNNFANTVTDRSIRNVSEKVNGGSNGIEDRIMLTEKAYKILK